MFVYAVQKDEVFKKSEEFLIFCEFSLFRQFDLKKRLAGDDDVRFRGQFDKNLVIFLFSEGVD